jgi:iron(III) transport system ATP-binding protein
MLVIEKISKLYADEIGIFPISFEVLPAECLVIAGESGSGKTTLLKLLAGFLGEDNGEIFFNHQKLTSPHELLVKGYDLIQLVQQDFKLLPNHRIWENIVYPIRQKSVQYQKEKLDFLSEILDIKFLLQRFPRELSGGQQQRVAIAKALANEPSVLLLDEPFNQADFSHKIDLQNILKEIKKNLESSLIIVTHNPQEALTLADKILILEKGKMLQYDTPENIYQKPFNLYVAKLFGKVNIFSKKLAKILNVLPKKNDFQAIRPENIKISDQKTNLKATIKEINFAGTHYEYIVNLADKTTWTIWQKHKSIIKNEFVFLDFHQEDLLF